MSKSQAAAPAGWPVHRNKDWYLASHPTLPVHDILASDGGVVGWLLGWPIFPNGSMAAEPWRLPPSVVAPDQFEAELYRLGGRLGAVFLSSQAQRFYLDACGTLSAVFCPGLGVVASTLGLIPQSQADDWNEELIEAMGIPEKDNWFPFGLTPRRSVERLLPDFYLDLRNWKAMRYWPGGELPVVEDIPAAVGEIASILNRTITAVAERHELHMGLTAGRDTRMLLACAREHIRRIRFFTFAVPGPIGRLDVQVARRIARRFKLDHVILPVTAPTEDQVRQWLFRTGHCLAGSWSLLSAYQRLDPHRAVLLGVAGELGRGFHWRDGDDANSAIAAADLLARRKTPQTPQTLQRARQWLEELPVRNALTVWGLHYHEQFDGCWASPQLYGLQRQGLFMYPFSHRRVVELMLSLPTEYRRQLRLENDMIASRWPELLELPFNWPLGISGYLYSINWRVQAIRKRLRGAIRTGGKPS